MIIKKKKEKIKNDYKKEKIKNDYKKEKRKKKK